MNIDYADIFQNFTKYILNMALSFSYLVDEILVNVISP